MINTLHIKNELEQLTRLYEFLDLHTSAYGLEEQLTMQIKLALEEVVTNVILYAYPNKKDQDIRIDMNYGNKQLAIVITDKGTPFNPLEMKEPDITLPPEERPIGGLGIYLVKQLRTEVTYSRSSGKNILTMTKDIDMADFDIKEISALKLKLRIIEKATLAGWIVVILGLYYDWDTIPGLTIVTIIILYIIKGRFRKQLKQKEYLAKIVEERTIELRIQRDQVLNESKKLSDALDALAKAQDELVRKEKLATVGQLTQGLVDRILNPINYINNFAGLSANLIKDLKANITEEQAVMSKENYADSIEILDMINSNLQKINEHGCNTVRIVKAMEELLKDRNGNTTSTDICELCKVNVDVIRKAFKEEIESKQIQIDILCPAEPAMAEIDIEQMNKVMLSLLKNSIYALLKKLQKEEFSPVITIQVEKRLNGTIYISIRDNGIGIEDNIKNKIFEPFFTTKPTAEAAGVGLYLCREVILNHHGSIIVKSEKDNFTEFMISIPIYQKSNNE